MPQLYFHASNNRFYSELGRLVSLASCGKRLHFIDLIISFFDDMAFNYHEGFQSYYCIVNSRDLNLRHHIATL